MNQFKKCYTDIMEAALDAYGTERILNFFDRVRREGLRDQSFPRLTANMGILIALGRKANLKPLWVEMMDFCCHAVRLGRADNDFSIRELCSAIFEAEAHHTVPPAKIAVWETELAGFDPQTLYTAVAKTPEDDLNNWAVYGAVSEWMRGLLCQTDVTPFVDLQLSTQMKRLDSWGMYRDPGCPILYDYATRVLLATLVFNGYDGRYANEIKESLKRSGEISLAMQSVTGEIPFGGRSNQFVFNEAYEAALFEYLAAVCQAEGETASAQTYKAAAELSADSILGWLHENPGHHIKNHYGIDSGIGCESYAYFDKYMISLASFIYLAYHFADDSIQADFSACPASPAILSASEDFHKLFIRHSGYFLELDTHADQDYDASGIGRIHKAGLPPALCLSAPCAQNPHYQLEFSNPAPMSLCPYILNAGNILTGAAPDAVYNVSGTEETGNSAVVFLECRWGETASVCAECRVSSAGVELSLTEDRDGGWMVPALESDGQDRSVIDTGDNFISVRYRNGICRVTFDKTSALSYTLYCNRNGRYRFYRVPGKHIRIEMDSLSSDLVGKTHSF